RAFASSIREEDGYGRSASTLCGRQLDDAAVAPGRAGRRLGSDSPGNREAGLRQPGGAGSRLSQAEGNGKGSVAGAPEGGREPGPGSDFQGPAAARPAGPGR